MKKFRTEEALDCGGGGPDQEPPPLLAREVPDYCQGETSAALRDELSKIGSERPPPVGECSPSYMFSPGESGGTFFRKGVIYSTPPTGKERKSAPCTSGVRQDRGSKASRKRKCEFPRPKVSSTLSEGFLDFLSSPENWDDVEGDINDVEAGLGVSKLQKLLKGGQQQARVLQQCSPVESISRPGLKKPVHTSLQISVSKPSSVTDVPRFYWPAGKGAPNPAVLGSLAKVEGTLKTIGLSVPFNRFGELISAAGIPLYWKKPFWMALGLTADESCPAKLFLTLLRSLLTEFPDEASRFSTIVSKGATNSALALGNNKARNSKDFEDQGKGSKSIELVMADFIPMIQDIVDTHPGLGFLRDAPEFHSRYITTVISRIFYKVNRSWTGAITLSELRRSNLLRVIKRLEEETDINSIPEYFSYEHFYVIYCKFWELDSDHDLLINQKDLASHAEHALSSRIIERIFSGTVLRGWDVSSPIRAAKDKMTYSDFVWFLLSEEDKQTPTAIEYWFRCLDMNGDGILSPYELQYFYSEQENRIEALGIEPLHFSNVYCQIVDMLHCSPTGIRLRDLKRNAHLAPNVFNTLFNLDKYLDHEQRDPFAAAASLGNSENGEGESPWIKYACVEYELLIAEEVPADHM